MHKSCIVTLVDRKSRFLLAGKCASKKVEDVTPVIIELLAKLPPEKRKTITLLAAKPLTSLALRANLTLRSKT